MSAVVERQPDLDPGLIDDIVFGNANGAGEDNRNVARMGALLAGPHQYARGDRQPPVRLRSRGSHPGQPRHRSR